MSQRCISTVTACALLLACVAAAGSPEQAAAPSFSVRVVATGLESPWEVAWGPDGYLWVTERVGKRVTRIDPETGSKSVALTIPDAYQAVGQDGVLGMALHPGLLRGTGNDFVYVVSTYDDDPGPRVEIYNRVTRYTYDPASASLGSPADIVTGLPAHDDHLAGRLVYGPDDKLYLSAGDQGSGWLQNYCNVNLAQTLPAAAEVARQDWIHYQGKILRLEPDGSIPPDNPVLEGVRSHVYTYGHRNPQGLVFAPEGTLYAAEHGPNTDDEVNRIVAGMNYGWPRVAGYRDDQAYAFADWPASDPTPCHELTFRSNQTPDSVPTYAESEWSHPDFMPPIQTFFTMPAGFTGVATIAASGLDIYTVEDGVPGWARSLLVAGLTQGAFFRMKLAPDGLGVDGEPEAVFKSTNRLRDMAISPDGTRFYIVTDNEGRTLDEAGSPTRALANPGSLLEFSWTGENE